MGKLVGRVCVGKSVGAGVDGREVGSKVGKNELLGEKEICSEILNATVS